MKEKKILLAVAPVFSPWHQAAGISYLAAFLRHHNISCDLENTNIRVLENILVENGYQKNLKYLKDVYNTLQLEGDKILNIYRNASFLEQEEIGAWDKIIIERNNVRYIPPRRYDKSLKSLREVIVRKHKSIFFRHFQEWTNSISSSITHIGISINDERQLILGFILGSVVKDLKPCLKVIFGGNVFSRLEHLYKKEEFGWFLKNCCDVIVWGEGFIPILDLLQNKKRKENIPSLVFLGEKNEAVVTEKPISGIDYSILPAPVLYPEKQWGGVNIPTLFFRPKCPMECHYCSISGGADDFLKGGKNTRRGKELVSHFANHSRELVSQKVGALEISNETMTPSEVIQMGGLTLFSNYMILSKSFLEIENCKEFYRAGLRITQIGLETLSGSALEAANKRWNTVENYGKILKNLTKSGIHVHIFIIIGLPGDTIIDVLRWFRFFRKNQHYFLTAKVGRHRVSRLSPESISQSEKITLDFSKDRDLDLNHWSKVSGWNSQSLRALRIVMEQLCRDHWAYKVTSCVPWGTRMFYSRAELLGFAKELEYEASSQAPYLHWAIQYLSRQLGWKVSEWKDFKKLAEKI